MKLQLTLFAGAAAAWNAERCFGAEPAQVHVQAAEGAASLAGPPIYQPDVVYHQPHVPYPAMPGAVPAYGLAHPQPIAVPAAGANMPGPAVVYPVPSVAVAPVPAAQAPDASHERHAVNDMLDTAASKERKARRAVLRGLLLVLMMNVLVMISQVVEGQPDRNNIPRMFFFTIPHLLYIGTVISLLLKFFNWIRRLLGRLEGDDAVQARKKHSVRNEHL